MVRLVERGPPVDDDRITDKLINGAIPLEDHLSHGRKVFVELSHHLLGRMRLAKACESDQVREQHGEFFALTPQRRLAGVLDQFFDDPGAHITGEYSPDLLGIALVGLPFFAFSLSKLPHSPIIRRHRQKKRHTQQNRAQLFSSLRLEQHVTSEFECPIRDARHGCEQHRPFEIARGPRDHDNSEVHHIEAGVIDPGHIEGGRYKQGVNDDEDGRDDTPRDDSGQSKEKSQVASH